MKIIVEDVSLVTFKFLTNPDSFSCRMSGEVYEQITPFETMSRDWNNDGDVYKDTIAKFKKISDVNRFSDDYLTLTKSRYRGLLSSGDIEVVG